MINAKKIIDEISSLLLFYEEYRKKAKYDDLSDLEDAVKTEVRVRLTSCLTRIAPKGSPYRSQIEFSPAFIVGALKALRADYEAGYLKTVETIVQGDIFTDFLEMSQYLIDNSYKDPAAVIVGAVLEEKLRLLCSTNNIPTTQNDKPIKADTMNAELYKANAYSKLDQKSITSWLDLRNKAAHGCFNEYTLEQVKIMYQGIQDFILRNQ
ncbi:MAG: hypothetical protein LHV68_08185 [Elusimicrobia bacterium]|nr:hypothetical protein [Candidatus Liberimonas magnetica]